MKIAHFAPFAPNACGLYEAARDMAKADDIHGGHEVKFVNTGVLRGGKREPRTVGDVDIRGGYKLRTSDYKDVKDFDVFVMHDGVDELFYVQTDAPIIKMMHGRPEYCFRLQQKGEINSYSHVIHDSNNKRIYKLLTFWDEHLPYWQTITDTDRVVSTGTPPIDADRFSADGPVFEFQPEEKGKINILIADSWRADADPFMIAHGALLAAKENNDIKIHMLACENPLGPWSNIFEGMKKQGALGKIYGRVLDMGEMYRACDLVLTPHIITTRISGESVMCGTPVVGPYGSKHAWRTYVENSPDGVCGALLDSIKDLGNKDKVKTDLEKIAKQYSLDSYADKMTKLYTEAIKWHSMK